MFRIVTDDDGHNYVIPDDKQEEWWEFLEDPEMPYITLPEWAKEIGGSVTRVVFPSYEIK